MGLAAYMRSGEDGEKTLPKKRGGGRENEGRGAKKPSQSLQRDCNFLAGGEGVADNLKEKSYQKKRVGSGRENVKRPRRRGKRGRFLGGGAPY